MDNPTSFKQAFQGLMPNPDTLLIGTVIKEDPLEIVLENDAKMILSANSLVVPRYLTNHQVSVDLRKAKGSIDSKTRATDGKHMHANGTHGGHNGGDGSHIHENDGEHEHWLATFTLTSGILSVYNALKKGEKVILLSYNNGKRYMVLDRVG